MNIKSKNNKFIKSFIEYAFLKQILMTIIIILATVNRYLNGTLDICIHQVKGFETAHSK